MRPLGTGSPEPGLGRRCHSPSTGTLPCGRKQAPSPRQRHRGLLQGSSLFKHRHTQVSHNQVFLQLCATTCLPFLPDPSRVSDAETGPRGRPPACLRRATDRRSLWPSPVCQPVPTSPYCICSAGSCAAGGAQRLCTGARACSSVTCARSHRAAGSRLLTARNPARADR